MRNEFDVLMEGILYNAWANRLWLEALVRKGSIQPDVGILQHALSAQEIWLRRCQGESPNQMPKPEVSSETIDNLSSEWIELLKVQSADEPPLIRYARTNGDRYEASLVDIARHVVNHGTYHRGELRGLCRARGDEDFPDTDLILFTFTQRPSG
jgi:uncharacterized damage-inducible protein DinB